MNPTTMRQRPEENILNLMRASLPGLNNSERKVAEAILADPERATHASIAQLAAQAGVSGPSVNRFSKRFNATGFPDLKLKLARCLAAGVGYASRSIEAGDRVQAYAPKIFNATINALELVRDSIDHRVIEQLVAAMLDAKKIHIFGLAASSAVALDAQLKLFRFKLPVSACSDVLVQRMLVAAAEAQDMFVFISYTGRTKELVAIAEDAKASGATLVSITAPDSPLARCCDLVVAVNAPEDTEQYIPMTSRIVDLVIVDVLVAGVALAKGPEFSAQLKKVKDSLKSTRFEP